MKITDNTIIELAKNSVRNFNELSENQIDNLIDKCQQYIIEYDDENTEIVENLLSDAIFYETKKRLGEAFIIE